MKTIILILTPISLVDSTSIIPLSIFDFIKDLIAKWGRRVIVTLLVILGLAMVLDGIGWFLGMPLIPV